MRILKKIGIAVLIIIALPFILALFIPRSYTVSVTETIDKPHQQVYDYVRMLTNQKEYSVWVMPDPNLDVEIIGTDGEVGAIQKWNSKLDEVGQGEQEITSLTPERMDVDLRFIRPFKGKAKAATIFKSVSEYQTQITAEFYSNDRYPFNLPSFLFGKKMIREAQQKNLKNIKKNLEG